MAGLPVIVVGSALDHGGAVAAGSPVLLAGGKMVARGGDACVCSKHGPTAIDPLTCSKTVFSGGLPVAMEGSKTLCGATLSGGCPSRLVS